MRNQGYLQRLIFEYKYLLNLKMKQSSQKMWRSSSISQFPIDFNAQEVKVGSSSIDKLPIRRKRSTPVLGNLPCPPSNEPELASLKRINLSLQRQNQRLKRQLNAYQQQSSNPTNKSSSYKDKVASRIQSSRISNKVDQESTALSSIKNNITRDIHESISGIYERYTQKRLLPSLQTLFEVAKEYFGEFKENYIKLKILGDHMKSEENKLKNKFNDLLYLFKVPIVFKDNPSLLQKSLSKQKKEHKIEKQKCLELISPIQTLQTFENSLKILCKNTKLLQKIKYNPFYLKFQKKMKSL